MQSKSSKTPLLAITMGDPAGVGPEVIARSWLSLATPPRRVVVGRAGIMQRAVQLVGDSLQVKSTDDLSVVDDDPRTMWVVDIPSAESDACLPGQLHAACGRAAHQALEIAMDWALADQVAGIVTAPIAKAALAAAGYANTGHTEILAERCGVGNVAMMLYLPPGGGLSQNAVGLGVVHVTLHCALHDVFRQLTSERIVDRCRLATDFVQQMLRANRMERSPRIGVAALNPHGGEGGLFGDEELTTIGPAVAAAQQLGLPVAGPWPCDTLMHRAAADEFDAVVAMYHDQGHIALKLLGLHAAVNITLGLPIVRTSVAHGTAFDRAWRGTADSRSMVQAIRVAQALVAAKNI